MKIHFAYILSLTILLFISCKDEKSTPEINVNYDKEIKENNYDFEDLVDLSLDSLRIKRNEVYAKRGYKFKSAELNNYFNKFDWYSPSHDDVRSMLTEIDKENIRKVIKAEKIKKNELVYSNTQKVIKPNASLTQIKMTEIGGVYHLPVKINGSEMFFILDTGASSISISMAEALFLVKNYKLLKEDLKGTAEFTDATGSISEGRIINLKEVVIGDIVLQNVEASVVNNLEAPLLLGQSALTKLLKFEIDYENEMLIIKN